MKLIVDGATGTVTVDDAEDLNALSVEVRGYPPGAPRSLPGALGQITDGYAFLDVNALRALVPLPRSCSWDERFDQAMEYARARGWSDASGRVRAHVTRPDAAAAPAAPAAPAAIAAPAAPAVTDARTTSTVASVPTTPTAPSTPIVPVSPSSRES